MLLISTYRLCKVCGAVSPRFLMGSCSVCVCVCARVCMRVHAHTHSLTSPSPFTPPQVLLTLLLPCDMYTWHLWTRLAFISLGRVARLCDLEGCFLLLPFLSCLCFPLAFPALSVATRYFGKVVLNVAIFFLPVFASCLLVSSRVCALHKKWRQDLLLHLPLLSLPELCGMSNWLVILVALCAKWK